MTYPWKNFKNNFFYAKNGKISPKFEQVNKG